MYVDLWTECQIFERILLDVVRMYSSSVDVKLSVVDPKFNFSLDQGSNFSDHFGSGSCLSNTESDLIKN